MSGVRRARKARRPRTARGTASYAATVGAVGGGDLAAAAEEIANGARELAATWAKTGAVVASIRVETLSENTALVTADAGAAYPAETRARHPLFGDRRHWYGPPGEPFMAPAADQRAGAAMARYANKIDAMCRKAGFA